MEKKLLQIVAKTQYPLEAFLFVQRGLDYTVRKVHGEQDPCSQPTNRHITGKQLCRGLRDYAIEQYGLMTRTVLRHWNINSTEDFGKIVFAMVDADLMQKTDQDSIGDFFEIYDFDQAFEPSLSIKEKT